MDERGALLKLPNRTAPRGDPEANRFLVLDRSLAGRTEFDEFIKKLAQKVLPKQSLFVMISGTLRGRLDSDDY